MSFTVRFSDFWPGFHPEQSVLYGIIRDVIKQDPVIIGKDSRYVDLEVCSNFTFSTIKEKAFLRIRGARSSDKLAEYVIRNDFGFRPTYSSNAKKRIWVTGENLRPPIDTFDLTLSSDATDQICKNVYFPYWMQRIDWGLVQVRHEIAPTPESLVIPRKSKITSKDICLFSSNKEPIRQKIISTLEPHYKISKYGSAYSNRVESKLSESQKFDLQICNENDLYPGYVTEKIQESWVSGNLAIWAGILPNKHMFNEDAFINVTNLTSDEILLKIHQLSLEEIKYKIDQPLFKDMPKLDSIHNAISELI
jgi:hypothetical protein